MNASRFQSFVILIVITVGFAPAVMSAESNVNARVILFIAEDAEAPKNYEKRLQSLVARTEKFFSDWSKHWKRPIEREAIFARDDEGDIVVTLVRGKLKSTGRAALPDIRAAAVENATEQLRLKPRQPVVWWILYDYAGVKGFQGGARGAGGTAINAYPPGKETIPVDVELAAPAMAEMAIKGTIHEFGHALGLPHIGPRPGLKLDNSLMGPINRAYWSKSGSRETGVHLTEAAATMLQRHPIFRKEAGDYRMPRNVAVEGLTAREADDGSLTITGKLSASHSAHSALLLDSQRGRFGDYWARSYVSSIEPKTGEFQITVTEPFDSGTCYLSFCFDNGFNTGDGQTPFQRGSAIQVSYRGEIGKRQFNAPK